MNIPSIILSTVAMLAGFYLLGGYVRALSIERAGTTWKERVAWRRARMRRFTGREGIRFGIGFVLLMFGVRDLSAVLFTEVLRDLPPINTLAESSPVMPDVLTYAVGTVIVVVGMLLVRYLDRRRSMKRGNGAVTGQ